MIDAAAVPAGLLVVYAGRCHRSSGGPKSCCGIPRIPRAPLTIQNRARRHYSCLADGKQVLMRSDVASHVINALRGAWQAMVRARMVPRSVREMRCTECWLQTAMAGSTGAPCTQ
jgi:hypothetical protein